MFIRKKYTIKDMFFWTRWEIFLFVSYGSIVTILFEVAGLHWLRLPWTPIALIGTAVAFLIGFQSNAAYGRIWEARKIWGAIVNESRTWGMMIRDMVTNEYAKETMSRSEILLEQRALIYRHIAWLTALRFAMRQKRKWETFLDHRTNREWSAKMSIPERDHTLEDELQKLLNQEEFEKVIDKSNKAAAILTLQSNHIRQLKEKGFIWEFSFLELESVLARLFEHQGKSERIKNFPYPRQFATLGYDFVKVFALMLPFGVIPEFARIGDSLLSEYPILGSYFVWLAIPFSAIITWIFHTMQRIGTVGENPFEGSANDVPISTIARGIEIDLREMMEEERHMIPEQYAVVHNVQM